MKLSNITLSLVFLLAVFMQGQKLFRCHTDGGVHFVSSCCEEAVAEESCCHAEPELPEKSISSQCCSEFEVQTVPNLNDKQNVRTDSKDIISFIFLPGKTIEVIVIRSSNTKTNPKAFPPDKSKSYLFNCIFIC